MKRRGFFTIGAITTILVVSAVGPVGATNHVDPTLGSALNIGGGGWDQGYGIAADGAGNTYISGKLEGSGVDFNPAGSPHLLRSNGGWDAFVAKYDPSGGGRGGVLDS